jgi:hypothetical protein
MRIRKQKPWTDRVAEKISGTLSETIQDPGWRKDMTSQAKDQARDLTMQAKDLTAQAAEVVKDAATTVGQNVSQGAGTLADKASVGISEVKDGMKDGMASSSGTKKRGGAVRRWMRRFVMLGAAGAAGRYFLDPQQGRARRQKLRARTSSTAATLGVGLDKAATAAHTAADMTSTDSNGTNGAMPGQRAQQATDTSVSTS